MDFSPPPGLDLSESKRSELYGAYCSTYILAVTAVALRLVCRTVVSKVGLWWDDYMICIAVTFATGNFIDMVIWVYRGVGTHIYLYGMTGLYHFLINLFVCEILYTLSICFTKYSVLLFYWRIFGTTSIRIPIYVLAFVVTGWGLGVIFTTIFQCVPTYGFWDKSIPSHCGVSVSEFFIGNSVPNIITDWALLLLPMPYIWKLHRNASQKVALSGVFILGGFICIISIVRLIIMLNAYKVPSIDETWVFVGPSKWTAVETNIGVVSACLPSLRPLTSFIKRLFLSRASTVSPQQNYQCASSLHYGAKHKKQMVDEETMLNLTGITVRTTLDVETTS
ncbi:hypothetical protein ASPBRDRAFT_45416 [Aspergillus brasiliensis CBS 101740]|uniref:Rhodopsin domain-containing protein n=1 Tax=Aspergillus brasiliensis (strain CBS 101740 / IMI 381727 / IBT 21946) TaxID=767769 RepID=A0A1L9UEK3_ASPBC|nr:hypothetical protein ASPBRDRAFT_45416 [Aspergillus brasiliensis CBS 101740]